MKFLVFWYCISFCDCQMSNDHAKPQLGVYWCVIMFGCYTGVSFPEGDQLKR